jgi:hypothetical protein
MEQNADEIRRLLGVPKRHVRRRNSCNSCLCSLLFKIRLPSSRLSALASLRLIPFPEEKSASVAGGAQLLTARGLHKPGRARKWDT